MECWSNGKTETNIPILQCSLAQTWLAGPELYILNFRNIAATTTYSKQVAPGQAITPILHLGNCCYETVYIEK